MNVASKSLQTTRAVNSYLPNKFSVYPSQDFGVMALRNPSNPGGIELRFVLVVYVLNVL